MSSSLGFSVYGDVSVSIGKNISLGFHLSFLFKPLDVLLAVHPFKSVNGFVFAVSQRLGKDLFLNLFYLYDDYQFNSFNLRHNTLRLGLTHKLKLFFIRK